MAILCLILQRPERWGSTMVVAITYAVRVRGQTGVELQQP